jgi:hypothetical protein
MIYENRMTGTQIAVCDVGIRPVSARASLVAKKA